MTCMRRSVLLLALLTTACGFHLRGVGGESSFPFASLRVAVAAGGVGDIIQRQLSLQPTLRLVPADPADALLTIEERPLDKQILTVNRYGRASEYQLNYRVRFALSVQGREWIYPTVLTLHRDYAFNESNPLGTEAEEALLMRDMRLDAAQQIIRRLAAAKAPAMTDVQPAASQPAP
ncbi:LPS assembly lipoprotein LptE [Chitinimonas sp.]|uniref:LPS-assembly lipoprotein LptE n=1 Tax=Chitinimonas sp. TaxID=1934313 RepID=UPI0035B014A5